MDFVGVIVLGVFLPLTLLACYRFKTAHAKTPRDECFALRMDDAIRPQTVKRSSQNYAR